MTTLTPTQQAWRARVEGAIELVAPALDLLLAVGDRVARTLESDDAWDPPVHPPARPPVAPDGGDGV